MLVRLTPVEELQQLFSEILMNKTDKVTKISPNSVLNGTSFGVAKVGQKAIKDVALVVSQILPDEADGQLLDSIAADRGIAGRFGASTSSTYIKIIADSGTTYNQGVHSFKSSTEGITFILEEDITIGDQGFGFAKVKSQETGSRTQVPPNSINSVNPQPAGHRYVTNEFRAVGGRDEESDDLFRKRIKEGANILARGTLAYLEQVFIKINNNVLRVFYHGTNTQGQPIIAISTQNGVDLSSQELGEILEQSQEFLGLTELKPFGTQDYGLELKNIEYQTIDVNFRAEIDPAVNVEDYRIEVQRRIAQYLDYRFWTPERKVEWDDLLAIAKSVRGARYIPDNYFNPNADIAIDKNKLPRISSFVLYDLDGNVISNDSGTIDPVFYPNQVDLNYQLTVLKNI